MKTIYIEPETYIVHMEQNEEGTLIAYDTNVFDGMADENIVLYRFVPQGYKYKDPVSGLTYSGMHMMPIKTETDVLIERFNTIISDLETTRTSDMNDVYAALTELAALVS